MSSSTPLQGVELIDCARANAKQGATTAAQLCGYGEDIATFQQELHQACQHIGIEIGQLKDLITAEHEIGRGRGIEVSPDSNSRL